MIGHIVFPTNTSPALVKRAAGTKLSPRPTSAQGATGLVRTVVRA